MQLVFQVRYLSIVAVVFSAIGTIMMFIMGAVTTVQAVGVYFGGHEPEALSTEAAVESTVELISSLDQFLFGLVLLVFSFGVYGLYVVGDAEAWARQRSRLRAPDWLKVTSLTELKVNLLEVAAVLLAVLFLKGVLTGTETIEWSALVVPIAVALFAGTIWLLRLSERDRPEE